MSRTLHALFREARRRGDVLFLPYVCVGYPTYRDSLRAAGAALSAGAHVLEAGMPFSDPIADGPVLQAATHRALSGGIRFSDGFQFLRDLRRVGYRQPLLLMTYLNPIERLGWDAFLGRLSAAGGDGVIVPDLPLEESAEPARRAERRGLSLIPFLSPTSPAGRIPRVDALRAPFVYYVSVTGVTGARRGFARGLLRDLKRLRLRLKTPLAVGFGISTPRQAARLRGRADGVIVGSALVRALDRAGRAGVPRTVSRFCQGFLAALGGARDLENDLPPPSSSFGGRRGLRPKRIPDGPVPREGRGLQVKP